MKINEIRLTGGQLEKKLTVLSWLNSELEKKFKTRTILVGGTAVELYSGGVFQSADIDVIYAVNEDINDILSKNGFERFGKSWINEDLDIEIEAPSAVLDGSMDKVSVITVGDGRIYAIGIEDLILDRLKAFCYWKDNTSLEQAVFLLKSTIAGKELDKIYVLDKILQEGNPLVDKLRKLPSDKNVLKILGK